MKQPSSAGIKSLLLLSVSLIIITAGNAQNTGKIDWSKDTISRADAVGAKNTYLNVVRGSGQKATEQMQIPVDKLKEILDACAASHITDITVMFASLRAKDLAHYRRNNPGSGAADADLEGSQVIVFRVPRSAFSKASAAEARPPVNNKLMLGLLAAGLVQLEEPYDDLPGAEGYLYFSIGSICPPPASCD